MPAVTVTAVALDSLLEPGTTRLYGSRQHRRRERSNDVAGDSGSANPSMAVEVRRTSSSFGNHFSPALYATPELTQIATGSQTPDTPSPYVLNHKRRDFRVLQVPVVSGPSDVDFTRVVREEGEGSGNVERNERILGLDETELGDGGGDVEKEERENDDLDDFFNPKESVSVMSSSDTEDGGYHLPNSGKGMAGLSGSEFYDATEDFLSDSSATHLSSLRSNINADLRSLRLNLFEEIERRKKVEESLVHMQNQWTKMVAHFSQLGLSFPPVPDEQNTQDETDQIAQVCQEILVCRFVSAAIESALARAEVESSAELVIESKNNEISRMHDRLRYYEAVNHEMSQRNQEAIEAVRQKRLTRRRRQRWIWASIGLAITIGSAILAHSYLPQTSEGEQSPSESADYAKSSSTR